MFALVLVTLFVQVLGQHYTPKEFTEDFASYGDNVQYFYLLAPFPYNAPEAIVEGSGLDSSSSTAFHAGLGIWNTNSDAKISVEFIANNYTGSLLPTIQNNEIVWNNTANIIITSPLSAESWSRASLISTSSGVSWNSLYDFLKEAESQYTYYQPVTVMTTNGQSTAFENNATTEYIGPTNSFEFVKELVDQLDNYGCQIDSFLDNVQISTFAYQSDVSATVKPTCIPNDATIVDWYSQIDSCYIEKFNEDPEVVAFLEAVQACYYISDFAYVYCSEDTSYKIHLVNFTDSVYDTPYVSEYPYTLPASNPVMRITPNAVDGFTLTILIILLIYAVRYFVINRMRRKHDKLKLQKDGHLVAENTVNKLKQIEEEENLTGDNRRLSGSDSAPYILEADYFHSRSKTYVNNVMQKFHPQQKSAWSRWFGSADKPMSEMEGSRGDPDSGV